MLICSPLYYIPKIRCIKMSTFSTVLMSLFAVAFIGATVDACGMPPAPPPAPMCCAPPAPPPAPCCGCGGRKKREAVQPVFKTEETPCPQLAWKELMEEKLFPNDAATSVNDIQLALFSRFPDEKFLVMCALAGEENEGKKFQGPPPTGLILPNKVSLSSRGDGYCNVVKGRIWCQAVSLSA